MKIEICRKHAEDKPTFWIPWV